METIHTLEKNTIQGVKDLIEINIDSAKGFRSASEKVDDADITRFFVRCAADRDENAAALTQFLKANGEPSPDGGTALGAMHRWWLELRGTIQSGDEHAMLAEAERGEDAIKAKYEKVLKETAGSALNDLIQKQYATVKKTHDTVRDMRDARA
ncbi:MAG: PA2169 family four-helix-bundle protein [Phycisphaerales bacterium]